MEGNVNSNEENDKNNSFQIEHEYQNILDTILFCKDCLMYPEYSIIINSKNTLTNKHSYKSIFSPRNINNRKLKKIYDPYLISVCKKAIIREKKQLPNYKEIIRNINTEFGIEETEKQNFDYFPKNKNQLTINNETSNTR